MQKNRWPTTIEFDEQLFDREEALNQVIDVIQNSIIAIQENVIHIFRHTTADDEKVLDYSFSILKRAKQVEGVLHKMEKRNRANGA